MLLAGSTNPGGRVPGPIEAVVEVLLVVGIPLWLAWWQRRAARRHEAQNEQEEARKARIRAARQPGRRR